ncbi:hypothetical protein KIPB_013381, partial [Kipferlia bialata]
LLSRLRKGVSSPNSALVVLNWNLMPWVTEAAEASSLTLAADGGLDRLIE